MVDGDELTFVAKAKGATHGLRYDPPGLPGIDPLWGRSVFHCPFCDGWETFRPDPAWPMPTGVSTRR